MEVIVWRSMRCQTQVKYIYPQKTATRTLYDKSINDDAVSFSGGETQILLQMATIIIIMLINKYINLFR